MSVRRVGLHVLPMVAALLTARLPVSYGTKDIPMHLTIEDGKVQALDTHQPEPSARPHGSTAVFELSPTIFHGNVLREPVGGQAEHWFVHFCANWWEPCQVLMEPYMEQAAHWQRQLNSDLMNVRARFAHVDCATHKVLCNEEPVEDYPTIMHYHRGRRVGRWIPSGKDDTDSLSVWLKAELGHVQAGTQAREASAAGVKAAGWAALLQQGLARDFLFIALVIIVNCWAFLSNMPPQPKEPQAATEASEAVAVLAPQSSLAPQVAEEGAQACRRPEREVGEEGPGAHGGVARFLPQEWSQRGASAVL
uniref:Thioredoxin domain-containing protein n=1 Tax=Pyrodinium bahamense TaxID=73915 RepID=A0A7S0B5H5_9DINO|eukprot:CAMPEP_0179086926 /NCGR_PEP_ID=MMETSP0796-20121207/39465_1 /TAXON_ID=73915 /ORGANISM="Pyrodinium bahamense, Strain pbaha01" /LENGTH=306 /DNA_ID=CAMNT_0020784419 /DNA_START=68 /DNA_END=988 /DNA_ORIENTATION=+